MTAKNLFMCNRDDFNYWTCMMYKTTGGTADYSVGVNVMPNGNILLSGITVTSATNYCNMAMMNKYGDVLWQKYWSFAANYLVGNVFVDGSGNIYVSSSSLSYFYIIKLSSDGVLQWCKTLYYTTSVFANSARTSVDDSGNVYTAGHYYSGTYPRGLIYKFSSSGAKVAERQWYYKTYTYINNITKDTSNNVITCGYSRDSESSGVMYGYVAKMTSALAHTWARVFYVSSSRPVYTTGNATDSAGNTYATCSVSDWADSANTYTAVVKLASDGSVTWQRSFALTNASPYTAVCVGDDGYIYALIFASESSTMYILKYNSSGTLQFQRSIGSLSLDNYDLTKISVQSGSMIINTNNTGQDILCLKLPSDGSRTGSIKIGSGTSTYAASSVTESAGYLLTATITPTVGDVIIMTLGPATPTFTTSPMTASTQGV